MSDSLSTHRSSKPRRDARRFYEASPYQGHDCDLSASSPPRFEVAREHFDEDDRDEECHFAPIIPLLEGLIKVNEWHIRRGAMVGTAAV